MIDRGPDGRLHTPGCSAHQHYRLGGRGALCWGRQVWYLLPRRVRRVITAGAYLTLAFALGACSVYALWLLFLGGRGL